MIAYSPLPFVKRLLVPGYLILGVAFLIPLIDLFVSTSPSHWGDLRWRFGFLGTLSSGMGGPILVLFFIYALGLAASDRKVAIFCAVVAAFFTFSLAGASGTFLLDALQMKRRVAASGQARFDAQTTQATLKLVLDSVLSLVLLISIIRTINMGRLLPGDNKDSGSLLVGVKADKRREFAGSTDGQDILSEASYPGDADVDDSAEVASISAGTARSLNLRAADSPSVSPVQGRPLQGRESSSVVPSPTRVPVAPIAAALPPVAAPAAAPPTVNPEVAAPVAAVPAAPAPVQSQPAAPAQVTPAQPSKPLQAPKSTARPPSIGGPMRPPPKKPSE